MTAPGVAELLEKIRTSAPDSLSLADYRALAREMAPHVGALEPVRLSILSSFTTQLLDPYLVVEGARHGLGVEVRHGGFGRFEQALMDPDHREDRRALEVLVVMMRLEDFDPDLSFRYYAPDRNSFDGFAEGVLGRLEDCVSLFRRRSDGPVLLSNFAVPEPRPLSVFEANDPDSLTHRIHELNRELARRRARHAGVNVWDYAGLIASRGGGSWSDPRLEALARAPVSGPNQPVLARHLLRSVRAVIKPTAKCLVVDLDDTLWGGTIGDDGLRGIQLGDEHPGSAFKRFQRAVLGLRDRGVLLAVCSSNDASVALEAMDGHPEMLLRSTHFAASRVNWRPKSENLREIAEELNIGLDSIVFFDDNPVVRAEVRDRLPQVLVVDVPVDPVHYVDTLAAVPELDTPALTMEDRLRATAVQADGDRRLALRGAVSLDDFLLSLGMVARIGRLDDRTSQRVSQLVAKTNQYNLTTRRRSQAELDAMAARDGTFVHWLRLADRYGDLGLVAVTVLIVEGPVATIDSLIMSCRVANRGVEQTMVAHLARLARELGCERLVGEYVPTAKNRPVCNLYPTLGFVTDGESGGATRYGLVLTDEIIEAPRFMNVVFD
jgi:FkbH-like protein